ncbi:MAG: DUF349 domain-containing protein [Fermentimonas sp.]|nr:DUF349 domain-containing protein [Fermentimonas sp.]
MNTKNNLENEKQPLSEDQSVNKLDSQIESTELNTESVQEVAEGIKAEAIETELLEQTAELLAESKPVTEELTEPAAQEEPVVEKTTEPLPDTETIVQEATEPLAEAEPAAEETTESLEKADSVVEEEIETKLQVESDSKSEIDYHLEDANGDGSDDSDEEDDEIDEHSVSEDPGATLMSIEDIVKQLRILLEKGSLQRKHVEEYKNQFYRSLRNEIESQKHVFTADGGEEIDFVAKEPEIYTEGKELLLKIKEKRAELVAKEDELKEKNVARKLSIIDQIKLLTETQGLEDFNKTYQDFKALQQEWSEIKLVPQSKVNELWKLYQRYVEKFYDLVRINNEFREYDFKKNLELKTDLSEAAERLDEEADVISAFHQLQNLHQEWREIGPVSRKDREVIWNRFKAASTVINKKYQEHFEELRGKEDENLELKSAICEKLESIDYSKIKSIKDWNRNVKDVLELQSQWRKIGYVPRKWNTKIYKRYRAACDLFFNNKNDYYKSLRGEMDDNLKKKIELCERAEALKDSTDWKKTTQDLIEIQRQWKTIGIIPRKYVDSIWKRFITACDFFFEQKKLNTSSRYEEENNNLIAKRDIVESIKKIDSTIKDDEAITLLHELMAKWQAVGHVPYKMKDVSYHEFYEATEAQFDRLKVNKADRKLESFKSNISDMAKSGNAKNQLYFEREKLMRQYDRMKNELQTYENNIGFLSISSKKGNNLLDDMNQKVDKIKTELQLIIKKVEAIDAEL